MLYRIAHSHNLSWITWNERYWSPISISYLEDQFSRYISFTVWIYSFTGLRWVYHWIHASQLVGINFLTPIFLFSLRCGLFLTDNLDESDDRDGWAGSHLIIPISRVLIISPLIIPMRWTVWKRSEWLHLSFHIPSRWDSMDFLLVSKILQAQSITIGQTLWPFSLQWFFLPEELLIR